MDVVVVVVVVVVDVVVVVVVVVAAAAAAVAVAASLPFWCRFGSRGTFHEVSALEVPLAFLILIARHGRLMVEVICVLGRPLEVPYFYFELKQFFQILSR